MGKGAGIGSMLLEVAGGLGGLATKLGTLGLLAGTGVAAYKLATWLGVGKLGEWIGGKLADWLLPDGSTPPSRSRYVAPRKSDNAKPAVVNMMLDGRKVGQALMGPMASGLCAIGRRKLRRHAHAGARRAQSGALMLPKGTTRVRMS
jgi:hypothetical protein